MFKSYVYGRIPMFTFYSVLRAVFQILEAEINQNISKSVLKITPKTNPKNQDDHGSNWSNFCEGFFGIQVDNELIAVRNISQRTANIEDIRGSSGILGCRLGP